MQCLQAVPVIGLLRSVALSTDAYSFRQMLIESGGSLMHILEMAMPLTGRSDL
jgi:hypothetical protein